MIAQVYSDDNIEVYRFLSTDEKPLSCKHGSRALEIDTGRKYIFDAENSIWQEVHDSDEDRPVDAYTKEETQALLLTKVDKVSGMGLSQESYTTAEKQKLAGIEAGATAVTVDSALSSTSTNPVQNQAVYADKQKQDAALAEVENKGAKNLLPLTGESTDIFTINADGTMTANGSSSTSKRDFAYYIGAPPKGRFVFSGCPPTGSNTTYRMFLQSVVGSTYTTLATLTGDPVEVDLTNIDKIRVLMSIYAGYTPNNIKFSPMLCTKEEWDISQAYAPYGKTNAELTSDISALSTEINYAVNTGAKNFAVPFSPISTTDISVTKNADGSYTFACTNVSENRVVRVANIGDMASGTYKISGITGGSSTTYMLGLYNTGSTAVKYQHTNPEESYTGDVSGFSLRVRVISGYSGTFTVYPMIRSAAITDSTFVPYAKTNRELTVENNSQQSEIDYAVNTGAKNLLKITATSQTIKGVTFTVNDDRTVTVNGTNDGTGASTFVIVSHEQAITIPDGNYILSGCPAGGGASVPFDLRWYMYSSGKSAYDSGNGASVKKSGNTPASNIAIVVKTGQTANNLTFKPMLRPASVTDNTFVPYAPTNRELYEEKIDHDLPVVSGSILDYADTFAPGIYFARQSSSTGSGKPVNNRRYAYNIYVYSSATATIMAIEGEDPGNPRIFLTNKISGTWGSWYKFEGTQVT